MEMKLRISQDGEYITVDVVDASGQIKSTPLYVTTKSPFKCKTYDFEEHKWWNATIFLNDGKLTVKDETGLDFDIEPQDLLDTTQFHF
jgi:hypothetical protein